MKTVILSKRFDVHERWQEILYFAKHLGMIGKIVRQNTLWPELKSKTVVRMYWDNFIWLCRHNELNVHYKNYGMDIVGLRTAKEYLSHYEFIKTRRYQLKASEAKNKCSYSALLTDKYVFSQYFSKRLGKSRVTESLALVFKDIVFKSDGTQVPLADYLKSLNEKVIYKPINQASARDVYSLRSTSSGLLVDGKEMLISKFRECLHYDKGVFEKYIIQHPLIAEVNPDSVNTLRIITIIGERELFGSTPLDKVDIFSSYFRTALIKGVSADNMGRGGMFVGVSHEGRFNEEGFCVERHLKLHGRYRKHPITGFTLKNFKVPYWGEAVDLVKKAHKCISGVKSIGWDVAITENGPIIIEGNIDWAFPHQQIANGPLKLRWYNLFAKSNPNKRCSR